MAITLEWALGQIFIDFYLLFYHLLTTNGKVYLHMYISFLLFFVLFISIFFIFVLLYILTTFTPFIQPFILTNKFVSRGTYHKANVSINVVKWDRGWGVGYLHYIHVYIHMFTHLFTFHARSYTKKYNTIQNIYRNIIQKQIKVL